VVVKVVKVADVEALQKSGSIVHVKAMDEDNETVKIPSQTTSINVPHLGYSPGRDLYYMLTHNTQYLFFLCLINPRGHCHCCQTALFFNRSRAWNFFPVAIADFVKRKNCIS
jgi:hypothetical protein